MAGVIDYQKMAEEVGQLHIGFSKMFHFEESFLIHGSDRILIWMNQKNDTVYATDIVNQFSLSPGRVANIVKQLELKKLIRRLRDEKDLRRYKIELTEQGKRKAKESWEAVVGGYAALFEKMEAEDVDNMLHLMKKLASL